MTDAQAKLNYADYAKTPDDERYELLDGELVRVPTPLVNHQRVLGNLMLKVGSFVWERNLGCVYPRPTDVVLSDPTVVEPDILFVSSQRSHIIARKHIRGAPDLVVEIIDPPTAERDRTVKLDLYAQHGVNEYWMVDPDAKNIMVLVRGKNGFKVSGIFVEVQCLRSPMLAGFSIDLDAVF